MEDWALIRRLAAEGVPQTEIAERLGISRTTVWKAVSSDSPPRYARAAGPTSFSPFEARVRQLLAETPSMPATVLAERVGWTGSIRWFRENVARDRVGRISYRRVIWREVQHGERTSNAAVGDGGL